MSDYSHRKGSRLSIRLFSLIPSDVVDFAFTDFTVDSLHPLSPVHTTTIEVACRISTCIVFDTILLAVILSLSAHTFCLWDFSHFQWSISRRKNSHCTEEF